MMKTKHHVAGMAMMLAASVLLMLLSMAVGSCRSVRFVPVERDSVRTEVRYVTDWAHDSVWIETKAEKDTVWRTELRWKVRYVNRHDTVYVKVKDESSEAAAALADAEKKINKEKILARTLTAYAIGNLAAIGLVILFIIWYGKRKQ